MDAATHQMTLLHSRHRCTERDAGMGREIPYWIEEELLEAVKFAIAMQELKMSNRARELEDPGSRG